MLLAANFIEEGKNKFSVFCIKISCWFIGNYDFWLIQNGTRYADSLLFAT